MKKIILAIASIMLLLMHNIAQVPVKVLDASTKQPLPFATVECSEKNWGVYTDSAGRANVPGDVVGKRTTFSYVGYISQTVIVENKEMNIFLQANARKLDDILVTACKSFLMKEVGVRDKKSSPFFVYGSTSGGLMWGTMLKNTSGKPSKIEGIGYGAKELWKGANPNAPVRLRLFVIDTISNLPGEEITNELIEIIPGSFGWKVFDLKKYNMVMPPHGIVVAFEMIYAGAQFSFYHTHNMKDGTKKTKEYYGWQLVGVTGKEVVGLIKFPGGDWFATKRNDGNGRGPQLILRVKECN